jgi:hypothetical protein
MLGCKLLKERNQTRQKLKESYNAEFLATIERAEKQIILARHGMRLLKLLDDTPVVPGDVRPAYEGGAQARQILNDAEDDLRDWRPDVEDAGQDEKLQQTTSRGLEHGSRDSGYAGTQRTLDRTSYDDKDTADYVRDDAAATSQTTTAVGQEQHMSGGASGAAVSDEELRGEQVSSSSPPPALSEVGRSESLSRGVKGLFAEF